MSKRVNAMRDFIVSHPWWCVLIVAAMFWIPRAGIWMTVGSWLAIIAVCAKHRSLPAAKVSARVVSSGSSMELNPLRRFWNVLLRGSEIRCWVYGAMR